MPTLFEKLTTAGLPIASASDEEGVRVTAGTQLTPAQDQLMNDIIFEHQQPAQWLEVLQDRANRLQLKNEYLATIASLQQIEDAVAPTNAQVIAGVKFIAKTLKLLLRLIAKSYQ